jgi:hypothetical protein
MNINEVNKYLDYFNNSSISITKGKINFEYSQSKGFHCKAADNINKREFIFKVPREYVACSYDLFPLKYELIEGIIDSLARKTKYETTEKSEIFHYLLTYYLIMLDYKDDSGKGIDSIYPNLEGKVLKEYLHIGFNKIGEYLKYMPNVTFSKYEFRKEEIKLLKSLGLNTYDLYDYEGLHDQIINYMKVAHPYLNVY